MKLAITGAIDCDVHIAPPPTRLLLPFMDDYWQEQMVTRGIQNMDFAMTSDPPRAPASARADWRPERGAAGSGLDMLQRGVLDPLRLRHAICTMLHGALALHTEDMAGVLCRAANDWVAREWLDREPRLRASILVPWQNPGLAAAEIERVAPDRRFVQVLMLASGDQPLGRRTYWPIYQAAEKHGLAIGIHAGGSYRHAPTSSGWPSYHLEDQVVQQQLFDGQLTSLIAEGVFTKFPAIKVVLIESGFTWLPTFLWRVTKIWKGLRAEVPWVHRSPAEIVRESVRFTLQPFDAPPDPKQLEITMEQVGSDRLLLFSTDYPHHRFEADEVLPEGFTEGQIQLMAIDNPLETYARL